MTEIQKHLKDREARKQIARTVKRRLSIVIAFLIAILLGLLFRIGERIWPIWISDHRTQMAGVMVLAIILLILLSPVIIENSSNPRALSGPGKNPEGPRLG
jgi:undecaprenyl pyrophosphate phosphatase UppP